MARRGDGAEPAIDDPSRRIRVGGMSFHRAIVLVSDAGWACAHRLPDGSVSVHAGPQQRRTTTRLPVLRAQAALRAQTKTTVAALRASGLVRPGTKREVSMGLSWHGVLTMGSLTLLSAYSGFHLAGAWGFPRPVGALVGLVFLTLLWGLLIAAATAPVGTSRLAHLHGAEHAVIDAWRRRGQDWDEALEESRHRIPECGTTYLLWQVLGLYAVTVAVLWPPLPGHFAAGALSVAWIGWPAAVPELMRHAPARRFMGRLGLFGQRISTRRPEPQDLALAVAAGRALFGNDPVPVLEGVPGRPEDIVRPVVQHDTWTGKKRRWGKVAAGTGFVAAIGSIVALIGSGQPAGFDGNLGRALAYLSGVTVLMLSMWLGLRSGLFQPGRLGTRYTHHSSRAPHTSTFRAWTLGLLVVLYGSSGLLTLAMLDLVDEPPTDPDVPVTSSDLWVFTLGIAWLATAGLLLSLAAGLHYWRKRGRRRGTSPITTP